MFDEMGEQLAEYFKVIEVPKGFETFEKTPKQTFFVLSEKLLISLEIR